MASVTNCSYWVERIGYWSNDAKETYSLTTFVGLWMRVFMDLRIEEEGLLKALYGLKHGRSIIGILLSSGR